MSGIYISFPFCRQKCTYCNFASGVGTEKSRRDYVDALTAELVAGETQKPIETVYFGGGTPSLLEPEELARLLAPLGSTWSEATLETAPGDISEEAAHAWARLGINRVSFGVQSFDRKVAAASGRKHDLALVEHELAVLARAGIRRVNVDLIAGLAHQTNTTWDADLDAVERLSGRFGVEHVSIYMLEVDDDSRLGGEMRAGGKRYGAQATPSEDAIAAMYERAVERLAQCGIERYEISNFARPGGESRHNLKYWRFEPYTGFGADAHSFDGATRWWNVRTAAEYLARFQAGRPVRQETETLDDRRLWEDRLLTGLRTRSGVPLEPGRVDQASLAKLTERGWIEPDPDNIRLTDQGVLFSNEVLAELIF